MSLASASTRHALKSSSARRSSIVAYSTCSGLGDNATLAQRALDHRAPDLRSPLRERFVHDDYIHRSAEAPQRTPQPDGLGGTIVDLALDHKEVKIASVARFPASVRAEQNHPRGRRRRIEQRPTGALDQLISGNAAHQ
jgi:hypothetical protein